MFFALYEYDSGFLGTGGAGIIGRGLYADAIDAVRDAVEDIATNREDYEGEDGAGWYRVDVWDVEDEYADADAAFTAWENEQITDDGDVLHLHVPTDDEDDE